MKRITGPVSRVLGTAGKNKEVWLFHPARLRYTLKYVPDGPPLVQVVHRFFSLYKT